MVLENQFKFMLLGKLTNFLRRNLWRSLLASLLFTFVKPALFGSFWKTFLILYFGLIIVDLLLIFVIAKIQSKKFPQKFSYEFFENEIRIENLDNFETKILGWDEINKVSEDENLFIFNHKKSFGLQYVFIGKNKLDTAQLERLKLFLRKNGKLA